MNLSADASAGQADSFSGLPFSAEALLNRQPWGILALDAQRRIQYLNQHASFWCQAPLATLLHQPLAEAPLPPAIRAALLPLLDAQAAQPSEVWLPQQEQWLLLTAMHQPAGEVVVYWQNITPRKQREQQYQALADNTPDILTRWGADLRLRYANAALAAKIGAPLAALLHKTKQEMGLPEAVAGPYMAAVQWVFATGQPQEHYHALPTPQGEEAYFSRLVPELRDGRVETVLGIARDVTALRAHEAEALRLRDELALRTTDQYHALFHRLDQGFCIVEVQFDETGQQAADFRYLELNPAFARQSGMPADCVGKSIRELLPDLEQFWFDTYGHVARTGEALRVEHPVPQLGRWFDVHAFPTGGPGAHQLAVLFSDITARKLAEERLRRSAAADTFRLQLADALGPLADPAAVEEAVTHLARRHFGTDRCYYCEIAGGQAIIRRDAAGVGLPSVAGTYALADFALLQACIEAGRPFRVYDVRQDPGIDDNLRQLCVQLQVISCLNVPVIKAGQAVGELCLVQSVPREWTEADVALAMEVAERTWAAVERGRAEEALRASEEKYRAIFTSITEGFSLLDVQFDADGAASDIIIRDVNPAQERIDGMRAVIGQRVRELLPDIEPKWIERYAQVARSGKPAQFEDWSVANQRWYKVAASRVGGSGSPLVAVVYDDITERKRHEATLAFLAQVSQDFADLTTVAAIVQRLGERLGQHLGVRQSLFAEVHAAEETLTAHGWNADESPGLASSYRLRDFLAEELLAACQRGEVSAVSDTQTDPRVHAASYGALGIHSFIAVPLVREGQWRLLLSVTDEQPRAWAADEVELLRELAGRLWLRLERARAEEALRRSEEQLRLFVTASSDVLYRMDADWQHMLCLNGKGFLADTTAPYVSWLEAYIPPADQAAVGAAIQAAIASRQYFELEHRVFRADSSVAWTFSRAVPLLGEQGNIIEWFGAATDVTARKQAEELQLRLAQQQQLFEAVQEAQEAERRRISESLHNGIGQILYATKLQLDRLPDAPAPSPRHEAARLLSEAIQQTRTLSHELTPAILEEFGLELTLRSVCRTLNMPTLRWHCHLVFEDAPRCPCRCSWRCIG